MGLFDRFKKPKASAPPDSPEINALISNLGAADWEVRLDAALRLGQLGAAAAAAQVALEEATSDENGEVCTAAADALSRIRRALHA